MTTTEKTNGTESRQVKAANKAKVAASLALHAAFKAYQRYQVADCIAKDIPIDAGNSSTFAEWSEEEMSK